MTPGQLRRSRRQARLDAESGAAEGEVKSKSVGPKWGASRRRGPMDKRNKIKEKMTSLADMNEDMTSSHIRFGEVHAPSERLTILSIAQDTLQAKFNFG
eukprot:9496263-Pyramimonas_sp.AAC.3